MTTTAKPVRVVKRPVVQESGYVTGFGYRTRTIGHSVAVILSDGSEVTCSHAHKNDDTARACATKIVARINKALEA